MFHSEKGKHKSIAQKAMLVGLTLGGKSLTEAGNFLPDLKAHHKQVAHYVKVSLFLFFLFN